jgi:hypothetical protein
VKVLVFLYLKVILFVSTSKILFNTSIGKKKDLKIGLGLLRLKSYLFMYLAFDSDNSGYIGIVCVNLLLLLSD